ncbi:CRE-PTR-16 protein [Oopsacas minuta]|uniref:CRE-PTR-16 protein n=1 Tax=Oopsacas minuta TaxID=111878 RepID=A0AAV7KJJ4_9METZ|nr:CRE-PTR-16 protein [Oopsacas minuta]
MEKNRVAIVNLYLQGKSQSEILKILNFPKSRRKLKYRTINRYKDTGSTSDRQISGRPTSATTTQKRKVIGSRIQRNLQRSIRKMALKLKIPRESVRTIVKSDMGLFPYKKKKVHFIPAQIKEKRLARSKALLARFASFGLDEIYSRMRNYSRLSRRTIVKTIEYCPLLHLPYHKSIDASKEFSILTQ